MTSLLGTDRLTFGERLALARRVANIEQSALATALSISRTTLSNWEHEKAAAPFSKVVEIARLTGQSVEWFAEGVDHKSEG